MLPMIFASNLTNCHHFELKEDVLMTPEQRSIVRPGVDSTWRFHCTLRRWVINSRLEAYLRKHTALQLKYFSYLFGENNASPLLFWGDFSWYYCYFKSLHLPKSLNLLFVIEPRWGIFICLLNRRTEQLWDAEEAKLTVASKVTGDINLSAADLSWDFLHPQSYAITLSQHFDRPIYFRFMSL